MLTKTGRTLLKVAADNDYDKKHGISPFMRSMIDMYARHEGKPLAPLQESQDIRAEVKKRLTELNVKLRTTQNVQEDDKVISKGGYALSADPLTGMPKEVLHLPKSIKLTTHLKDVVPYKTSDSQKFLYDAFGLAHETLEAEDAARSNNQKYIDQMYLFERDGEEHNASLCKKYEGKLDDFGVGKYYYDDRGNKYKRAGDHTSIRVLVDEARLMNMSRNALKRLDNGKYFLPLANSRKTLGVDRLLASGLQDQNRTSVYGEKLTDDEYKTISDYLYKNPNIHNENVEKKDKFGNTIKGKHYDIKVYFV